MGDNQKKKGNGVAGLFLLFGWLLFILLALIFYFYFYEDLPFLPGNILTEKQGEVSDNNSGYETRYSYQTNANMEINALIADFYTGLAACDQESLQQLVTDASQFADMAAYEKRAEAVSGYSNINCYTLPGYTEDAVIVYVTCNLAIVGVNSTPLNLDQFYVVHTENGYKIDNRVQDEAVQSYIDKQNENDDIKALYKSVQDDINQCLANDTRFAEFYNKLYTNE